MWKTYKPRTYENYPYNVNKTKMFLHKINSVFVPREGFIGKGRGKKFYEKGRLGRGKWYPREREGEKKKGEGKIRVERENFI